MKTSPHILEIIDDLESRAFADGIEKRVVGSVIVISNEVLLLRRSNEDDFLPGYVEIPGGGVDEGETLLDALRRENIEETGMDIAQVIDYQGSFDYLSGSGKRTRQFNFLVEPTSNEVRCDPKEHSAFYWVQLRDSKTLEALNMSPQMRRVVGSIGDNLP